MPDNYVNVSASFDVVLIGDSHHLGLIHSSWPCALRAANLSLSTKGLLSLKTMIFEEI